MVATNGATPTTEYTGTVTRVNDRGLLLEGRPSWLNVSKFAGSVTLPEAGDRVRVTLDKAGYVRDVESSALYPTAVRISSQALRAAILRGQARTPSSSGRRA